jgi:tetratricopeptide (TPR) repeat protein
MAVGMLPLAAWMAFATFYYGFPFPNTAYAKLTNGIPSSALMVQGCYYFWNSLRVDPLTLPVIAAGLGVAFWQRKARHACIAAGILLYLVYLLRIGGDFMSGRYFTAPLLAALAILGSLDWRQPRAWGSAVAAIVLLGCCSIRPLAWSEKGFDMTRTQTRRAIDAESGVCDERAYYFHSTGFARQGRAGRSFYQFDWVQPTQWLRTAAEMQGQPLAVEIGAVGFPGFLMGPRFHFMDLFGLSDPLLARLPPWPDPYWRVGHFRRGTPVGYLETVRTGKNCLREPHLAEYYNHLQLITQGRLWDWNRLATIWNMNLGRYDRLLEPTIREIRATPQDPFHFVDPFLLLGDQKEVQERKERNIAAFTEAIKRDPKNPMTHANRGVLHAMLHMNNEAIRDYSRAIELAPHDAILYVRRGTIYGRQGGFDAAIADFDRAVELDPNCISAYTQRATAYAKKGDLDRAIESMNRAIELEPGDGDSYLARGNLYDKRGDRKLALSDFARYISLFPAHGCDGYFRMVQVLLNTDELRTAYDLGRVLPQKLPEAIRDLAWVLATHPDAQYRNGDEAVSYAQVAVAVSPKESAELLDTLAAAYAEAGRFPEAVATARKALALPAHGSQDAPPEAIRGRLQLYEARQAYHLSPAPPAR